MTLKRKFGNIVLNTLSNYVGQGNLKAVADMAIHMFIERNIEVECKNFLQKVYVAGIIDPIIFEMK